MKTLQRATPCVGICSTTYGDQVCRGCKRYAHEVVQWNGYDERQRDLVWQRLFDLRQEAVAAVLEVADEDLFGAALESMKLSNEGAWTLLAYELLLRTVRREQPLETLGLAVRGAPTDTLTLLRDIDADIYKRAGAHFEHSYRVPAS